GQVLAMVGSADYYNVGIGGQFNVITGGLGRQPGSSFKIYDYATAFSNGYTPATLINDTQGKIDGHAFVDWDHRSEGLITLRQALAESRNIPAILLLKNLGYTRVFQTARLMGLTSADLRPDRGLAQAIGATEVVPLEHFNAYSVLASGGISHAPTVIVAWMGHTCAGSCPSNVNTDLNVVWGVMGAGQIFRDVFNAYEASRPVRDFQVPDGLRKMTVCRASGLLATDACSGQTITDW